MVVWLQMILWQQLQMTTNVYLNFPISTTKAGEDLAAASTTARAWRASLSYNIKKNKNLAKPNKKIIPSYVIFKVLFWDLGLNLWYIK